MRPSTAVRRRSPNACSYTLLLGSRIIAAGTGSIKIAWVRWFELLRSRTRIIRAALCISLSLLAFPLACQNTTADADAELERFQILAIGSALLSLNSAQKLATDGVGVTGFLPNESAAARYEFTPGADGGHLLAVYTNTDAVRKLDAILALEVSGGRSLFRVDRNGGGPAGYVERRESVLSIQTYRATVSAAPGTFGSFAIAVAGSAVSGGGSCVVSASECRDYNAGADETRARADCTDASGTFETGSCTATARVGQCTSAGANTGIFTQSGYSPGFLNATLYQAHCLAMYGVDQFVVN